MALRFALSAKGFVSLPRKSCNDRLPKSQRRPSIAQKLSDRIAQSFYVQNLMRRAERALTSWLTPSPQARHLHLHEHVELLAAVAVRVPPDLFAWSTTPTRKRHLWGLRLRDLAEKGSEKGFIVTIFGRMVSIIFVAGLTLLGSFGSGESAGGSVRATLDRLYRHIPGSQHLVASSAGVLVFPTVVKAGFGIGGEYGEGELLVGDRAVGRYNTVAGSIGFQMGAEAKSVIIIFVTQHALETFRQVDGWKVGVDGSVAILTVGAGASVDTNNITSPVVGFILDPQGLMYNLTLEGSKISRMR